MTNKEAIETLKNYEKTACNNCSIICYNRCKLLDAIRLAVDALEEAQLDIKALKYDLPELFKPHYDGGYLKEGEENAAN